MERRCIYCGKSTDLSESDIIPDALTNARIFNKNVCRIDHNNRFSDLFESKVISALAFITNELDIKSSKGKQYAPYEATVTIEGVPYKVSLSNDKSLFSKPVLKSTDASQMIGSYDTLIKIAKGEKSVQAIDVNQIQFEKSVKIDNSIFFDSAMFRMVAKIAYEWYCAENNVVDYHPEFESIVSYITTGNGDCPVSIIQTVKLYEILSNELNMGSHALFAFESANGEIDVVVSFFGLIMYRVIVTKAKPTFCSKNFMFIELCTDSSRKKIIQESQENAEAHFIKCLSLENFVAGPSCSGIQFMVLSPTPDTADLPTYLSTYPFLSDMIKCFDEIRDDINSPNETINQILFTQLQQILQGSLLHIKSLKRFVNDHFDEGHTPILLNPNASNKKDTMLFYSVFAIGMSELSEINSSTFQRLLRERLNLASNEELVVTDELETKFKNEILSTPGYSDILERGAELIKKWTT